MTPEFLTYVRHLSKQDRKTLTQKTLKTVEEVGELAKVVLPYENAYATTHRFVERERILEESVDTILCALSCAYDLDFTDEEIDDMLLRKSAKWNQLQINEADVKYPLPYEIHVTVHRETDSVLFLQDYLNSFKLICGQADVKPIILDLQGKDGYTKMIDVMTSSKHFGTNATAYDEAMRIKRSLVGAGLEVVRVKIETVPWHPAAPKILAKDMPPNCYFEAHVPVSITEGDQQRLRDHLAVQIGRGQLHMSNNTFKKNPDGTSVVMLTLRRDDCVARVFKQDVGSLVSFLEEGKIGTVGKVHTEFAVYDTKVSHDATWIAG